ncbi:hypothetical protein GCM10027280_58430 [Micromonospora polyrhachis]|uniref:Uncharacterized protein n=1 Tax=Micromonospora polyrhachis TaxID=1282883 RepID=A0A7W7WLZ4_9ACTN|nr:hypothetical protein [Micromonospora polyrhachis]MBB4956656.1 hypothetical protein [Micromonospora polyrhachis]
MNRAGNIALAMGVGYLLGRRRKLRTALVLGVAAATGRLGKGPVARLLDGGKAENTPTEKTTDAGGPLNRLGNAGKAAARTAIGKPVDLLTERLNASAEALREGGKPKREERQPQGDEQAGRTGESG